MNTLHQIINSIVAGMSLITVLWLAAVKITKMEVKVDTLWGMLLKRGVVEGVQKGLMTVNSPVRLVNNSGLMLESMADELREFYATKCKGKNESDAALAIEGQFGSRLALEVCIPNKISLGVCILIALAVAKGCLSLTEILDINLPEEATVKPSKT